MDVSRLHVVMRPARADDLPHLDEVRQAAFAPIFAAFRSMLGEDIYALAQAREDAAQGALLLSLLAQSPAGRSMRPSGGGLSSVLWRSGSTTTRT